MSKHTPGPWHVDIEETWPADAPCFITAYSGGPLCIVDNREDARLISAAPDLYEACEAAVSMGDTRKVRAMLDAALNKARGEE